MRDRSFYIRPGSLKVSDKASDAVAYAYSAIGKFVVQVFFGKQSKPVYHYSFKSEEARAAFVRRTFTERQETLARKRKYAEELRAAGPGLVVGDILNTCWGYEQTNREFFEVTDVRGKHVIVREVRQVRTGGDRGKCVPQAGDYIGEPLRRLAKDGRVKIDDVRTARKWNTAIVAGVAIGPAVEWTAYH